MSQAPQIYKIEPLTSDEISYLKSLAPVVKEHGVEVTSAMYNHLFETFPAVKSFFNQTNQFTKRQPKVLAFSLYAYITNLDDLSPISDFVEQIVVKHCGLGVLPEQYPVVLECLVFAFTKILGKEAINDKFIKIFAKAYGNLAQLLIDAEFNYYHKLQWSGFKDFKVAKLVKECNDVTSVYITPVDGTVLKSGKPGQYIGIRWNLPGQNFELSREYSVSNDSQDLKNSNCFRISVRLIPNGLVSEYVNSGNLKIDDVIRVTSPIGKFFYEDSENVTKETFTTVNLFAGGIGITPMISICETALENGKKVNLFYSNRSKESRAFDKWLIELKEKYPNTFNLQEFISKDGNKLTAENFPTIQDKENSDNYLLGPVEYMNFVKQRLNSQGIENIKIEYFGPTDV
ncbi:hypothetical protein B5S28_g2349 [[Candida] boidinii]|uniref:Unnamed protein product n=1 Tax=Candida boidinii TaxID=5477 RepID=A0ACB5TK03_CANBO|nr:hypothetical protein B5S28_g2349 [[Candida] boidinii]OWB63093.1 hypothetical protein B5S29_g4048 [[Candida] boidinii]GME90194.1 unnamed protein product [[Candida] boidinii]